MDHVRAWLVAFVLTVALESPIVVLFYRDLEPRRAPRLHSIRRIGVPA